MYEEIEGSTYLDRLSVRQSKKPTLVNLVYYCEVITIAKLKTWAPCGKGLYKHKSCRLQKRVGTKIELASREQTRSNRISRHIARAILRLFRQVPTPPQLSHHTLRALV